ncbi:MAG: FkbM family methyltransferase [Crocosphaera sp.]
MNNGAIIEKIPSLPYPLSIVLFTRYPAPGKVKTRLAWDIGDRTAAEIHRYTMSHTLKVLLEEMKGVNIVVNYTGANSATQMVQGFAPKLASKITQGIDSGILYFIEQPSTSFGERPNYIAQQLERVIIIAADTPGITSEILNEAITYVNREEAVMGLTADGGYYLIGLPYYQDVFTPINYGLGDVSQQTYSLMEDNYVCASFLKHTLIDIDEVSDLQSLGLMHLLETNQIGISVIIPTLNEVDAIYHTLESLVKRAEDSQNIEILVVDGGSQDATLQCVETFKQDYPEIKVQWLCVSSIGRAFQMNVGLRHSSGTYVVFCHADTLLPAKWDTVVRSVLSEESVKLAYFDLQFNHNHLGLKAVAWTVNYIRRSPYGDQVFCLRRDYFKQINGFDYLSLLEDVTVISKIGFKHCQRIPQSVITNPRKYQNSHGEYSYSSILKNVTKNWGIMIGKGLLKLPACQLRKFYYPSSQTELLEVPFQDKLYTFKYFFPQQLLHKLLIWKVIYYQKSMNQLIPHLFHYCQGNDLFIDIGSNEGIVSCLLSMMLTENRIKTDIIAFEPFHHLSQLFQDNLSLYKNELKNHIFLENIALGNTRKSYYLKLDGDSSYFVNYQDNDHDLSVKCILLDDYQFTANRKISLIKITVDGRELEILQGMNRTIEKHQPVIIFKQSILSIFSLLNYKNNGQNIDQKIITFLNTFNYEIKQLTNIDYIAYPTSISVT